MKDIWSLGPSILHCINPYSNTTSVFLKTFKVITPPGKHHQSECALVCLYLQGLSLPVAKASPFPLTGFLISKKISSHPKQTGSSFSKSPEKDSRKSDYQGRHRPNFLSDSPSFLGGFETGSWFRWFCDSCRTLPEQVHRSNIRQVRNHDLILFPRGTWCQIQLTEHLKASGNDIFA